MAIAATDGLPGRGGRLWLAAGALLAGLGVAAGAFGAHALRGRLAPDALAVFETAVRYHQLHALALVAAAAAAPRLHRRLFKAAAILFTLGIPLFSGSLMLVVAGTRAAGVVTPLGGLCWLAAWLLLALAAWRGDPQGAV